MRSLNMLRQASSLRAAARLASLRTTSRAIAARSYASRVHEEPDPQLMGYPQLPEIPRATLPAKGWDDMLERRNFNEPIHEQEELLSMWGPDIPVTDPQTATRQFLIAVASFISFGFIVKYALTPEPPAVRRQYPYNGLVRELGSQEETKARPESLEESD